MSPSSEAAKAQQSHRRGHRRPLRDRSLEGQVALVSGASSGVGWQTACELGEEGLKLCLTARRREPLEALRRSLAERGIEAIVVPADVTRAEDVDAVVAQCIAAFGRLDVLVNVPGVQLFAPFEGYRWEEITRIVDVNFFGYLRFARAALPAFRRQRKGHIINVLSVFAEMGFPLFSIYAATKHALLGWADSLRLELKGSGVDVSNVLLPPVATPFYDVAPTRLGREPRPPPPVHSPGAAARAIVRCAQRPRPRYVPALLQGKLAIAARRALPGLVDAALQRWGMSLVTGRRPVERPEGNLFAPVEAHAGPRGTARVTPPWRRLTANAAALAGLAGVAVAVLWGANGIVRRVRGRDSYAKQGE